MGLYDSFIVPEMICPRCKKTIKNVDFQTKDLFNLLNTYHLGDKVPTNANRIQVLATCDACTEVIKEPKFEVCYTFLKGYAILEKEVFVSLEVWRYKHDVPKNKQVVAILEIPRKEPRYPEGVKCSECGADQDYIGKDSFFCELCGRPTKRKEEAKPHE